MSSPSNPAPDSPEAGDVDTESLYGSPPDGSDGGSDTSPTEAEPGQADDVPSGANEGPPQA